jgi:EAL domain-containing protein (putative c-di-GMP-specific phosphodiesterase class I)
MVQGYLFSPPVPAEKFRTLLHRDRQALSSAIA